MKQRTVWGDLVPYDQVWRAGANENTVLSMSTPFSVGGQQLPAGDYGLHVIPTKAEWTVILNKESTAWGSFFYDQAKDAVRFTTRPQPGEFQEHLAYTFESPGPAGVTLTLHWEKVALPIPITVDTPAVVSDNLQQQLHNLPGFFWQSFAQAASWSARNNANLDRAAGVGRQGHRDESQLPDVTRKGPGARTQGRLGRCGRLARGGDEGRNRSRHQRLRLRADGCRKGGRGHRGLPQERRGSSGLMEHL